MSPNIFSCSAEWFEKLKDEQPRVIVATWSEEGGEKLNEWLERLQKFEDEGVPVFVCDIESCPSIAEKLGARGGGETIVFERGVEKGRLSPGQDLEAELARVKEWAS